MIDLLAFCDIGVVIESRDEFLEYIKIVEPTCYGSPVGSEWTGNNSIYPFRIRAAKEWGFNIKTHYNKEITLSEFKKEQGIMKYKEGDVLENGVHILTIEGIVGRVYICTDGYDTGSLCTEAEIKNFSLTTDAPDLTELTLEDVAKMAGVDVDNLRVKD